MKSSTLPTDVTETEVILDLSRLLSRIAHPTPTGVDRCEMAYARALLNILPKDQLKFGAVHPLGVYGRLSHRAVLRFLNLTEERWESRGFKSAWERRRFIATTLTSLRPRRIRSEHGKRRVYLLASHSNLTRPKLVQRILDREQAAMVCLVHDLIPLQFPEYARADGVAKHGLRMKTVMAYADGIITNSHATMAALSPWLDQSNHRHDVAVAYLGTHVGVAGPVDQSIESRPYYACIGTIEPRKNHLLLLNLWRKMATERGAINIPKLVIIGRRGWENEQVVDMLERCAVLRNCVEEHNNLSDDGVAKMLMGSRALLMPSFAEGYGMPVCEALALGVPVICSDLPSLREAGGGVPDYLAPLDGPAWERAVSDYSSPSSAARSAQLQRLSGWQPPTWSQHIDVVLNIVKRVVA